MLNNITDKDMERFIPDKEVPLKEKTISLITDEDMKRFIPDQLPKTLIEEIPNPSAGSLTRIYSDGTKEEVSADMKRTPLTGKVYSETLTEKTYDKPVEYKSDRSFGGAVLEGAGNLPSNIGEAAKGLWDMATSPVQTAKSIGNIGIGLINQMTSDDLNIDLEIEGMSKEDADETLSAMWHGTVDKYTDYDKFKDALASNPLEMLMDVASFVPAGQVAKVVTKVKGTKLGKAIVAAPEKALKAAVETIHPMGGQVDDIAFFDALDIGHPLSKKGLSSKGFESKLREDLKKDRKKYTDLYRENLPHNKHIKKEDKLKASSKSLNDYHLSVKKIIQDDKVVENIGKSLKRKFPQKEHSKKINEAIDILNKERSSYNFMGESVFPDLDFRERLLEVIADKKDIVFKKAIDEYIDTTTGLIKGKIEKLGKKTYGLNYEKAVNVRNTLKKHYDNVPKNNWVSTLKELGMPSVFGLGGLAVNPTLGILSSVVTSPIGRAAIARVSYKAGKAGLWIGNKAISKKGIVVYNMLKKIQDAQTKLEELKVNNNNNKDK